MADNAATAPDARVIQTAYGLEVVPRDVFKRVDDIFTLLNRADVTVEVSFPVLPTDPPTADIDPGRTQDFRILTTKPGAYDYHVSVMFTDKFSRSFTLRASGGSDPRIIVDF